MIAVATAPTDWTGYVEVNQTPTATTVKAMPPWMQETDEAWGRLLELHEGWNSYRAHAISRDAIIKASEILNAVMLMNTPAPSVLPTPPGGVQLEWHERGIDLEVEVTPRLQVLMVFEDEETETSDERDVTAALHVLRDHLAELTRRPD
jgi:hypothetical protein